jgi:hypothetical protein
MRRRRPAPAPGHELEPRVPPLSAWPADGIVGTVGSGPSAGAAIAAVVERDANGSYVDYVLDLPVDHLLDAAGEFVIDDWASDTRVPGQEGGLIDFVTRAVDVCWSTEPGLVDAYVRAQKKSP